MAHSSMSASATASPRRIVAAPFWQRQCGVTHNGVNPPKLQKPTRAAFTASGLLPAGLVWLRSRSPCEVTGTFFFLRRHAATVGARSVCRAPTVKAGTASDLGMVLQRGGA
jgi:hypothetical protein